MFVDCFWEIDFWSKWDLKETPNLFLRKMCHTDRYHRKECECLYCWLFLSDRFLGEVGFKRNYFNGTINCLKNENMPATHTSKSPQTKKKGPGTRPPTLWIHDVSCERTQDQKWSIFEESKIATHWHAGSSWVPMYRIPRGECSQLWPCTFDILIRVWSCGFWRLFCRGH